MGKSKDKIRRKVEQALRETGLHWHIEDPANGHRQVYLEGRKVGVIRICPGERHDAKQILAKIRTRVREIHHGNA